MQVLKKKKMKLEHPPPLGLFRVRKEQGDPDFSLYSNVL